MYASFTPMSVFMSSEDVYVRVCFVVWRTAQSRAGSVTFQINQAACQSYINTPGFYLHR